LQLPLQAAFSLQPYCNPMATLSSKRQSGFHVAPRHLVTLQIDARHGLSRMFQQRLDLLQRTPMYP